MEPLAVEGDDAGRLLAAVLEGVQAERGDRRRVRMPEDAEDAALFAQPVAVEIEPGGAWPRLLVGSMRLAFRSRRRRRAALGTAVASWRAPAAFDGAIVLRRSGSSSSGFGFFSRL